MAFKSQIPEQYWELVDQYRDELIAQAFTILGNREDAEDVAQETLCDALRDPAKLSSAGSIGAWLKTLNRCNAIDRQRAKRRSKDSKLIRLQESPEKTFTTGGFNFLELRDSMKAALETLPPELRNVVVLRYWEHLSYGQIAERLKMQPGAVQRRLLEASALLCAALKPAHPTSPAPAQDPSSAPPHKESRRIK